MPNPRCYPRTPAQTNLIALRNVILSLVVTVASGSCAPVPNGIYDLSIPVHAKLCVTRAGTPVAGAEVRIGLGLRGVPDSRNSDALMGTTDENGCIDSETEFWFGVSRPLTIFQSIVAYVTVVVGGKTVYEEQYSLKALERGVGITVS